VLALTLDLSFVIAGLDPAIHEAEQQINLHGYAR
jgi:hypothetical protein